MIAIKGNREEKILDIDQDNYLEMGYTIYDNKLKVVATPEKENKELTTAKAKIKELEDIVAEKEAKIKELEDISSKNSKDKDKNKNKDKNKSE
ncbi:MAG: hypothetical protein HFJ12_01565 [Bacilli bacterium]|nr:hypothetical protein [Bacilli bacterium]